MPKTVFLHAARDAQLASLAKLNGIPKTEMLERLIVTECAMHADLPDDIRNLAIHVANGLVCPEIGKLGAPILTPAHARQVADAFEALIEGEDRAAKSFRFGPEKDVEWLFARKGAGLLTRLRYEETDDEATETFTLSLARDYIRQLRNSATRAEKQKA